MRTRLAVAATAAILITSTSAHAITNQFAVESKAGSPGGQQIHGLQEGTTVLVQFPVVRSNAQGNWRGSGYLVQTPGTYMFNADVNIQLDNYGINDCLIDLFIDKTMVGSAYMTAFGPNANTGLPVVMSMNGTVMLPFSAGTTVKVTLSVWPGCDGHVRDAFPGAHFNGGKM